MNSTGIERFTGVGTPDLARLLETKIARQSQSLNQFSNFPTRRATVPWVRMVIGPRIFYCGILVAEFDEAGDELLVSESALAEIHASQKDSESSHRVRLSSHLEEL